MNDSRRVLYGVLIVTALAAAAGRLFSAQAIVEPSINRNESEPQTAERPRVWPKAVPKATPMFGSNDRSRWATVRSLVEEGTFVVGRRDRQMMLQTSVLPLGNLDPLQALAASRVGFELRTRRSDSGIIFETEFQSIDKVLHPAKQ